MGSILRFLTVLVMQLKMTARVENKTNFEGSDGSMFREKCGLRDSQ